MPHSRGYRRTGSLRRDGPHDAKSVVAFIHVIALVSALRIDPVVCAARNWARTPASLRLRQAAMGASVYLLNERPTLRHATLFDAFDVPTESCQPSIPDREGAICTICVMSQCTR